ncbi:MAG: RNB domain-containing ribonuclease, partial [Coriobacteriia bacterium]|nr:RNB domain-containing ribonuclease [Coriobacteriia bacterium]
MIRLSRQGYGFVTTPEGEYFVLPSRLGGAMDGDLVEVSWLRGQEQRRRAAESRSGSQQSDQATGRSSGQPRDRLGGVIHILERSHQTVIGSLEERDGLRVVRPSDERIPYDIFIDSRAVSKPAQDGDIVVVRLTSWPSRWVAASGYIEEVVGKADDARIDSEVICRKHGIRSVFGAAALEQARELAESGEAVDATSRLLFRRDLSELVTFTIDPADARDFDDALSVEFADGQLLLGVHIADVSAFLPPESALDVEAAERTTSVYLPDRVIPMLPGELSDGLCSLQPGQHRLTVSVIISVNNDCSVAGSEFFLSTIKSQAALTYDQVDALLAKDGEAGLIDPPVDRQIDPPVDGQIDPPVANRLKALDRLAKKLLRRRLARG